MALNPEAIAEKPRGSVCHVCWLLQRLPNADAEVTRGWLAGDFEPADIIAEWEAEGYSLALPKVQSINRHRRTVQGRPGGCDGSAA